MLTRPNAYGGSDANSAAAPLRRELPHVRLEQLVDAAARVVPVVSVVSVVGVTVAAIQGLDAKLNAENAALQSRIAAREAMQLRILNALESSRPFATDR